MHSKNVRDKIIIHEVNLKERDTKMNNTIRYIYDCVGKYPPGLSNAYENIPASWSSMVFTRSKKSDLGKTPKMPASGHVKSPLIPMV